MLLGPSGLRPKQPRRGQLAVEPGAPSGTPSSFCKLPRPSTTGSIRTELVPPHRRAVLGAGNVAAKRSRQLSREPKEIDSSQPLQRQGERQGCWWQPSLWRGAQEKPKAETKIEARPSCSWCEHRGVNVQTQTEGAHCALEQGGTETLFDLPRNPHLHCSFEDEGGMDHVGLAQTLESNHFVQNSSSGAVANSEPGEKKVKIPGANASTVHAASAWDLAFSVLSKARTPLAAFFHTMLTSRSLAQRPPVPTTWPMPLPFPEVHSRRKAKLGAKGSLKLGINFLILILNWLSLGEQFDRSQMSHLALGTPLSAQQWEVVHRLKPLVSDWNEKADIGPAEMGRAASKMEAVEARLHELQVWAERLETDLTKYKGRTKSDAPVTPWGTHCDLGIVIGNLSGRMEHVAKEIEPHRLFFGAPPSFDPVPFLDSANRLQYERPLDYSRAPEENEKFPRVRVRCSLRSRLSFLECLDATGRLALLDLGEVRKGLGNGAFSIPKDQQKDRLVLDARAANQLENSEKRWIFSLGSAAQISHLHLKTDEVLIVHAEDLKDFYHSFVVGAQRRNRNHFQCKYRVSDVRHLNCFTSADLFPSGWVVPALATMAMGDTNAVAFGQCSHLSLILRTHEFKLSDFLTLNQKPSRERVRAGLMIDDFVVLEALDRSKLETIQEKPTEGARRMSTVQQAYKQYGLLRNTKKSVSNSTKAEFWGLTVDGMVGLARPNLTRVVPLAFLALQVVSLGRAHVGLLQVLSGAFVSIFQHRRRLMACLDEIYGAQRGRDQQDIVLLSKRLKDEILIAVGLLACSVIDLRLEPSSKLVCSDASSSAQAAAVAEVGKSRTSELHRHALQKGAWNRLLSPLQAYAREKGLLKTEAELPDFSFDMHPVWEEVVSCEHFRPLGKTKKIKGRRHINIGELEAALDAEREIGRSGPGTYFVSLLDSQVALACLLKGRSSSSIMNKLLRRSVPWHVGANLRAYYGYVRSKLNPSDHPTRDKKIPPPSREHVDWWYEIEEGDFESFDDFLRFHNVHPEQVAGLPEVDELLPDFVLDYRTGRQIRADRAKSFQCRDSPPVKTAQRHEGLPNILPSSSSKSGPPQWMSLSVLAFLEAFDESQFLFSRTRFATLQDAWAAGPGLLDLFCGTRGFARAFTELGCPWALSFDLKFGPSQDLSDATLQRNLRMGLSLGAFVAMAASPFCASFSTAITPPWRTHEYPAGRPELDPLQRAKVDEGHAHLDLILDLVADCMKLGIFFWVANPEQSWFWKQAGPRSWTERLGGEGYGDFRTDQCRWAAPWRKRTLFRTNCHLAGSKVLCNCSEPHVLLRGRCKQRGISYTKLAEPYPRRLCWFLATAFAIDCKYLGERRKLDIESCAKACGARIGEATNPGPRSSQRVRNEPLAAFHILEPQTRRMRERLWEDFTIWLEDNVGQGALTNFQICPVLLVKALEAYGHYSFSAGRSINYFRQLVAHVQKEYPLTRPFTQCAWQLISVWEVAEPVTHRAPMPEPILLAMMSIALAWKWYRFVCVSLLSFYGTLRVGEALKALRQDLLLPSDLLSEEPVLYLKISAPKTRRRGASVQYTTVREELAVELIVFFCEQLKGDQALYPYSASSYRRRWDALLQKLGVQPTFRLTPGSLRGGGAVAAHRRGLPISDLLWAMRLQNQRTLQFYLQETTAVSILPSLSHRSRSDIKMLQGLLPSLARIVMWRTACRD